MEPHELSCQNATCRTGLPGTFEVHGTTEVPSGQKLPITLMICTVCALPFTRADKTVSVGTKPRGSHG